VDKQHRTVSDTKEAEPGATATEVAPAGQPPAVSDLPWLLPQTPQYLRQFLIDLELLLPIDEKRTQYVLAKSSVDGNQSAAWKKYGKALPHYCGLVPPRVELLNLITLIGAYAAVDIEAQWISEIQPDNYGYIYIFFMCGAAVFYLLSLEYKKRLGRRVAIRLRCTRLAELLASWSTEVLRIYDYTAQPWQSLSLGRRPATLGATARLVARNLRWYLAPPRKYVALGWLAPVLNALPGLAVISLILSKWIHLLPVKVTVQLSVVFGMAIIAMVPYLLRNSYIEVMAAELVYYLRERLSHAGIGADTQQ
jgi:hypothetical protein